MGTRAIGSLILFMVGWGLAGAILGKVFGALLGGTVFGPLITWGFTIEIDPPIYLLVTTLPYGFSFRLTLLTMLGIVAGITMFATRRL